MNLAPIDYIASLTDDEKQRLKEIQAERRQLYDGYHKIVENLPSGEGKSYFMSEEGKARFDRIRELYKQEAEIKSNALKREMDAADTSPDDLLKSAISYLQNTIAYITLDKKFDGTEVNIWIINDFDKDIANLTTPYMRRLEKYPEQRKKFETHIEETLAKYPKAFTVYPDSEVVRYDAESQALGQPTLRERKREQFFKKTAFGEIYKAGENTAVPFVPVKELLHGYTQIMLDMVRRPNSLLANQAFKNPLEKENPGTYTSTKNTKKVKKYSTISLFSLDKELEERGIKVKKLGVFNELVYSVIYSVWYQECIINKKKHAIIYPENIYRSINSLDNHSFVSTIAVEEIEKAIEIFRGTTAKANVTEMLEEWGLDQTIGKLITNGVIDQKLLVATGGEFTLQNGNKIKGYYISSANEPVLGAFSRALKQITRIPAEMLTCEDKDNSMERAAIRYHLANAIQTMRCDKKFSRTVRLDPLYRDILGKGLSEISADKRRKLKNYITSYLDYLKKKGHIVDYEYQKDGRTISAISFTVKQLKQNEDE